MVDEKLSKFEPIFYPKSIAVIGASAEGVGFGTGFLRATQQFGFKGRLYTVNPRGGEILGLRA